MRYKICFIFLEIVFLHSCNSITKEDLQIVDKIELGLPDKLFYKRLDSLNIPRTSFYTKSFFSKEGEYEYKKISPYYTTRFDLPGYTDNRKFLNHYGLLIPSVDLGNNVNVVNILLIHTDICHFLHPDGEVNLTNNTGFYSEDQNIREDLINSILQLYQTKYGVPKDTIESQFTGFYAVEGAGISQYTCDKENTGKMYVWQTKALKISFFTGIKSYYSNFEVGKAYNSYFQTQRNEPAFIQNCRRFAYIKYEILPQVIKDKKLDNTNI